MEDIEEDDEEATIEIITQYWNKFSMHDTLKPTLKPDALRTESIMTLYNLRKVLTDYEKEHEYYTTANTQMEMYWPLLTLNQKA